jgi:hypothetical protein
VCTPSYVLYGSTVLNQVTHFNHSNSLHIRLSSHQTCDHSMSYK